MQVESGEDYEVVTTVNADKLSYNVPGTTYTVVAIPGGGAGKSGLPPFYHILLSLSSAYKNDRMLFKNHTNKIV